MKKETSRAYIASHIILRNNIFYQWETFFNNFQKGNEYMRQYLCDIWNSIDDTTINPDFYLNDIDRKVSKDDFYIFMKKINDFYVIFFVFPEPDSAMAQAKCVALVVGGTVPRYITMEISKINGTQKSYMACEWHFENNNFVHYNYGSMQQNTINEFIDIIKDLLEKAGNKPTALLECGLKNKTLNLVDLNNISFKDLLSLCIGKVYSNQRKFIDYLGDYNSWNTDITTGILKIDQKEFNVEYIGTTSPSIDNFWYSSIIERSIPNQYVYLMIAVKKLMESFGLNKFVENKINLDKDINPFNLSMIYIAFSPEKVTYFCGKGDTSIYMFVKNLPDSIFAKVEPNSFISTVMDILSTFNVNAKLMVKAFLIENDCEYTENENNIIGIFSDKSKIVFKFDGDNLISASGNLN